VDQFEKPIQDPEALFTTEQHAKLRSCSISTIRRERRERRGVPFIQINRNTVRYRRQDILDFIVARRVEVAK